MSKSPTEKTFKNKDELHETTPLSFSGGLILNPTYPKNIDEIPKIFYNVLRENCVDTKTPQAQEVCGIPPEFYNRFWDD